MTARPTGGLLTFDDGEKFLTELPTQIIQEQNPSSAKFYCLGLQRKNFSRRKICSQHYLQKLGFKQA